MTIIGSASYATTPYQRSAAGTSATGQGSDEAFGLPVESLKPIDLSQVSVTYFGAGLDDIDPDAIGYKPWAQNAGGSGGASDAATHPGLKNYAEVTVNGAVAATVDNFGRVTGTYETFMRLQDALTGAAPGAEAGPTLAQSRADAIAAALGGEVSKADTALTQEQFDAASKLATDAASPAQTDPLLALLDKVAKSEAA